MHNRLSPSKAKLFFNCPGSIAIQELIPDDGSSPAAAEGTTAAWLAEQSLKGLLDIETLRGKNEVHNAKGSDKPTVISDEMIDYISSYKKKIDSLASQYKNSTVYVEEYLSSPIHKELGGTPDAVIVADNVIHVIDLKYGIGVPVYVSNSLSTTNDYEEMNPQLGTYLVNAIHQFGKRNNYRISVYQPRCSRVPDWQTLAVTKQAVDVFSFLLSISAEEALSSNPRRNSGHWCTDSFCKAALICPERLSGVIEAAISSSSGGIPADETIERLEHLLSLKESVVSFLNKAEKELLKRALDGVDLNTYKIVEGRTCAKWKDYETVEALLSREDLLKEIRDRKPLFSFDDLKKVSMISITDAKKILPASVIQQCTLKGNGTPCLAPKSDKRPEYKPVTLTEGDFKTEE